MTLYFSYVRPFRRFWCGSVWGKYGKVQTIIDWSTPYKICHDVLCGSLYQISLG